MVGLQHALEVDHIAAVASLTARGSPLLSQAIRHGAAWGMGHSLTLLLVGGLVLLLDRTFSDRIALLLELGVGVMLVFLGCDVIGKMWREQVHLHSQRDKNKMLFLGHSHEPDSTPSPGLQRYVPLRGVPLRSLLVGMMHGMAGSAALIILTLKAVASPGLGVVYILLFGIGSVIGMVLLAAVISIPLKYSARGVIWVHDGIKGVIGVLTLGLGGIMIYRIGIAGGVLL